MHSRSRSSWVAYCYSVSDKGKTEGLRGRREGGGKKKKEERPYLQCVAIKVYDFYANKHLLLSFSSFLKGPLVFRRL